MGEGERRRLCRRRGRIRVVEEDEQEGGKRCQREAAVKEWEGGMCGVVDKEWRREGGWGGERDEE